MNINAWKTVSVVLVLAACTGDPRPRAGDASATPPSADPPAGGAPGRGGGLRVRSNYVGLQYDSLPGDFHYRGGSVLPRSPGAPPADYDFAHVGTPSGEMVWLDTIGAEVGKGLRARIVRAELVIPPLGPDERLFMASCDANGKLDPRVVAIVVNESGVSRFTKVRQAWRVNIPAARFDLLPLQGIVCEDPGS